MSNKIEEKDNSIPQDKQKDKQNRDEDTALIALCRANDHQAFDQLMLKYHKKIFNAAFRILGNYTQADEIAQEVFVRAYRGLAGFKQQSSFLTWLYAITVNLCRNQIKKNCRLACVCQSLDKPLETEEGVIIRELPDRNLTPAEALLQKEKESLIQAAINGLDSDFRLVLVLRDIQLLSYEQIAWVLKLNIGTVKSRLHRARVIMQKKLKDVI